MLGGSVKKLFLRAYAECDMVAPVALNHLMCSGLMCCHFKSMPLLKLRLSILHCTKSSVFMFLQSKHEGTVYSIRAKNKQTNK